MVEEGDKSQAAIAAEIAGKLYGLELLKAIYPEQSGQYYLLRDSGKPQGSTRRIWQDQPCFELPHTKVALFIIRKQFHLQSALNMMMIESRPTGKTGSTGSSWTLEGNLQDAGVKNAVWALAREAQNFKILGNYLISITVR